MPPPQNENEYAHAVLLFPYSFSKSYSFWCFEGLHRLADICRPFRAWSVWMLMKYIFGNCMQRLCLQFCCPLPIFRGRVREGAAKRELEWEIVCACGSAFPILVFKIVLVLMMRRFIFQEIKLGYKVLNPKCASLRTSAWGGPESAFASRDKCSG